MSPAQTRAEHTPARWTATEACYRGRQPGFTLKASGLNIGNRNIEIKFDARFNGSVEQARAIATEMVRCLNLGSKTSMAAHTPLQAAQADNFNHCEPCDEPAWREAAIARASAGQEGK